MKTIAIPTSEGEFIATYSPTGLTGLSFPGRGEKARHEEKNLTPDQRNWHKLTVVAVANVLAGKDPGELPPLDLTGTTSFQRRVWEIMRGIPLGKTLSYGEVAEAVGRATAVRATGGACGANPIPLLIPCHRVLAAHGGLGGFSGGLDWKRKLLAIEGVTYQER